LYEEKRMGFMMRGEVLLREVMEGRMEGKEKKNGNFGGII